MVFLFELLLPAIPLLHGGELLLLEVWETLEKPEKAVLLV